MAYLHPKQIVTHRRPTLKRQLTSLVYYLYLFSLSVYIYVYISVHLYPFYSAPRFLFTHSLLHILFVLFIRRSFSGFALINWTKIIYYCVHSGLRLDRMNVLLFMNYQPCVCVCVYVYACVCTKKKKQINKKK